MPDQALAVLRIQVHLAAAQREADDVADAKAALETAVAHGADWKTFTFE